ncbi:MAG: hypothetical protein GX601_09170 [Anaerolineales bacterium]|nr:hypothetical protein [Anaerolineales bacterium]
MNDKTHNDGGPAFPSDWPHGCTDEGMSLRDWFAGQAVAGIMANIGFNQFLPEIISKSAWAVADAMLAERDRRQA